MNPITFKEYKGIVRDYYRPFVNPPTLSNVNNENFVTKSELQSFIDGNHSHKHITDEKTNWGYISYFYPLSNDFMEEHDDKLDWRLIFQYQKMDFDFLYYLLTKKGKNNQEYMDIICRYQPLYKAQTTGTTYKEGNFLDKLLMDQKTKDLMNWDLLSMYQDLPEKIMLKYYKMVNWKLAALYQIHITNAILTAVPYLDLYISGTQDKNWLIRDYENGSKVSGQDRVSKLYDRYMNSSAVNNFQIVTLKMPDNMGDPQDVKFIKAYKGVCEWGHSKNNKNFKYELGNEYTSHADCNTRLEMEYYDPIKSNVSNKTTKSFKNDSSFGLYATTLQEAYKFQWKRIFIVLINFEDLAAVVNNGLTLRSRKIITYDCLQSNSQLPNYSTGANSPSSLIVNNFGTKIVTDQSDKNII